MYNCLNDIVGFAGVTPRSALTYADATAMLHYLFRAMGKRRDDEAAAKLNACADVFSPASNALGHALGLWKPAPTHPVILALAINQLRAEKTFEPAKSELREALAKVEQRLSVHRGYLSQWLEKLERADAIVFAFDRPAWDAAYANVGWNVTAAMEEIAHFSSVDESDDRRQALAELAEAKLEAEQAALPAAEPTNDAVVTCAQAPAKKTHKPKRKR